MPTVSVVIPSYNYARYLPDAVNSVLAQSYADWELIIVNDGSSDDSLEVAWSFAKGDSRIAVVSQPNAGVSAARNTGIAASTGKYVLPLDADDCVAPTMLEKTVAVLDNTSEVAIAYTDKFIFGDPALPPQGSDFAEYDVEALKKRLIFFYCALYRREAWETVGGYDETMAASEDWNFWLACARLGFHGRRIPERLFGVRVKPEGLHNVALERDLEWRARMVVNNASMFNEVTLAWAQSICDGVFDGPDVPAEILSSSEDLSQALFHLNRLQSIALRLNAENHDLRARLTEWEKAFPTGIPAQSSPAPMANTAA